MNDQSNIIDTIIAPASAIGGGIAVIRASGPLSGLIFRRLVQSPLQGPRIAQFVTLKHPTTEKILDRAVALYFQNPASFTGEDILELHIHGGRAVVQAVLDAALSLDPNIRMAQGGEFTKRAYLNGKIDLTEAEAIADLIAAETQSQMDVALTQMRGALRDLYEDWRGQIIRILAHLEATIDFVDEEDVPTNLFTDTRAKIAPLVNAITQHLDDQHLGERLREGFTIAVIGAPNAGKSSLVNLLARRDVAIVSDTPGTTRDTIEVHLNLGGYAVVLVDTAGLRTTNDAIESEGIRRATQRAAQADITLALFDGATQPDVETLNHITDKTIILQTKSDQEKTRLPIKTDLAISTETQENIDQLIVLLTTCITQQAGARNADTPLITRARHREAITDALQHLQRAAQNDDPVLLAEDIRLAARAVGRVTGRVDVEDLLDVIFKDFCIGK